MTRVLAVSLSRGECLRRLRNADGVECLSAADADDAARVLSDASVEYVLVGDVDAATGADILRLVDDEAPHASVTFLSDDGADVVDAVASADPVDVDASVQTVLERVTDAFIAVDRDWRVTYANDRAAEFFDCRVAELVGEELWEQFPEGVGGPFYEAYHRAIDEQEAVTVEAQSLLYDDVWLESRAYPDEDGLSVYFRDVTERKRVEAELRDRTDKTGALHRVAHELARATDESEVFERTVEAAEEILEFDICYVGTVQGDDIYPRAANDPVLVENDVIMGTDEGVSGYVARTGETYIVDDESTDPYAEPVDTSYSSALTIPLGDGDVGVFQALSTELGAFDEDDRELGELLAAHVTQAVERIRREADLRRERDRFAALFERISDAAVHYRLEEGRPVVRDVNPAFERVFGYDAERVVGESLSSLIEPPEGDLSGVEVDIERASEDVEVERRTAEGVRTFLVRISRAPSDGHEHDHDEAFALYTDITDRKRRERELERQNERLEEFANAVSHDLRNPLSVAKGYHELLEDDVGDEDAVDRIGNALDRMGDIIDDVLQLARQGQVVTDPAPVSLESVARRAWNTVDTGDATLDVRDDPTVLASESRLARLFENLFHNAVEHGSTDGQNGARSGDDGEHAGDGVTVTVGETPRGFFVADDGPGVPADIRERVFESGFTTDPEGTGFGLSIVRQISDAHGWTVSVSESRSGGARFDFSNVDWPRDVAAAE